MTLGEKIFKLRSEKGLSQEAFGDNLGVSRQSVSKWETDQSVPELEKIVAISELFGVTTDYLLKDEIPVEVQKADVQQTVHIHMPRPHYEYKSRRTIKGIPLLHVNIGLGLYRARGIFAIGNRAEGIFALGLLSAGVFSVGILSAGIVLSIGTLAVALAVAAGTLAIGCIAFGAIAVGIFSMGAITIGQFCCGALAYGRQVAIGDEAYGRIALGLSRAAGELYTEVNEDYRFDYPTIEKMINENVSSGWWPFRTWIKGILSLMSR